MQQNIDMKKNLLWNTVGSVYYSFCQWAMTIIIVYLTPNLEIIGILGLALTVTNSFTAISSFGMRSFQVSDLNNQYCNEEYIMSRRVSALAAYLLCILYSVFIGCSRDEFICIMLYMLLRLVESTEDVYQGVLQKNWRFDIIGKSYLLRGTLQILLFVIVFSCTNDLKWTFGAMFLSNFLVLLTYDIRYTKKIGKISHIRWNKRILNLYKSCSILVVYTFTINSLATVVRVSIRETLGSECLGIYTTIASPTVIIQLVASVVFSPFIPYFAEVYNKKEKDKFISYIKCSLIIIAVAFGVVNIFGVLFGELALNILYTVEIASNYKLLLPLLWCTFFTACIWFFADILIAIRKMGILSVGAITAFVLNFIQSKYFILRFGINGASYSQIAVEVLLMIVFFMVICREVKNLNRL